MSLGQVTDKRLELAAAAAAGHSQNTAASTAATDASRTQRRVYRNLCRQKRQAFWQWTVDTEKANPRRLLQSINTLLGYGRLPFINEISAERFQEFFEEKVASIRVSTESATVPDRCWSFGHVMALRPM